MEVKQGHAHEVDAHAHEHDDHHEHHDTFITKYIFTQDHKMISKQFLVTAILMACVAMGLSSIFRLQLGFPNMDLSWLKPVLGQWIVEGKLEKEFYF